MSQPAAAKPATRAGAASSIQLTSQEADADDEVPWKTKHIVLIRHGRSTWNEFLGQHLRRADWEEQERKRKGFRDTLKHMVRRDKLEEPRRDAGLRASSGPRVQSCQSSPSRSPPDSPPAAEDLQKRALRERSGGRALWEGVRGGVKQVANAITHAKAVANQVDHPLSTGGLLQARSLREAVELLVTDKPPEGCSAAALLGCKAWYVSPFLRALQTAAYALDPLYRRDPAVTMRVIPDAREIVRSHMSLDCQGKKGNVGVRVMARALAKTAEMVDEMELDSSEDKSKTLVRQAELRGISSTLCAMDLEEVAQVWWSEVRQFRKEQWEPEEDRVRRLVHRILTDKAPSVGLVAHSILFQRVIQLHWPKDPALQEQLRKAMRNGAPPETKDPLHDKIMNCGTLVLSWRYRESHTQQQLQAEITAAEFLFDGRMESALPPSERQCMEAQDLEEFGPEILEMDVALL